MRGRIVRFTILSLIFAAKLLSGSERAQVSDPNPQVLVRQIDHILIGSDKAEQLFRLFSEKLGLPVVWPYRSYGEFSSGGVGLGNVNIELIRSEPDQSGLTGMALEPTSLPNVLNTMNAQGLKHGSLAPFYQKDSTGADRLLWTTLDVTNLPPTDAIFFCKYNFDVDERRARIRQELQAHDGGPLGIESVLELLIGVSDMAAAQHDWSVLLGPIRPDQEPFWLTGSGPAIRLVAAKKDHLLLLRVKVKSVERARDFLKRERLLGTDTGREISLDAAHVAGAEIRFVQ